MDTASGTPGTRRTATSVPDAPASVLLSARGIRKSFAIGDRSLEILHGIDLDVRAGEVLAVTGASGAGKSTLMHVLGLLEEPTEGGVRLEGVDAWEAKHTTRARLRNTTIGFVFQFFHLLPELDAVENVLLPAMIEHSRWAFRRRRAELRSRAIGILEGFGLGARLRHRPAQLSGGERQRVAIARAVLPEPKLIIADEPTGNLDTATGETVLDLLFEEQARRGFALLLVTHDRRVAARCRRVLYMEDGAIQADSAMPVPD